MTMAILDLGARLMAGLLANNGVLFRQLKRALLKEELHEKILDDEKLRATLEFCESWEALRTVVKTDAAMEKRYNASKANLTYRKDLKDRLMDVICEGDRVFLSHGQMRFPDRGSLWTLIHEILINEDYYFQTDTDFPRTYWTAARTLAWRFITLKPSFQMPGSPVLNQSLPCENWQWKTSGNAAIKTAKYCPML